MNADIRIASPSDKRLIENLIPYYIYDMSEYMGWDPDSKGNYSGCDELLECWEKPGHSPYLIRAEGKVAVFAMVRPYPDVLIRSEILEFFILRKFKGNGVGRGSACLMFERHPGPWLIRVLDENKGARSFWTKVIRAYTGNEFAQSSEQYVCPHSGTWPMQYYRFESKG
jgi:predicted acetyltransferase